MNYTRVGKISHYFDKIQVAVLAVTEGSVKVGDTIRIGEEDTGFEQVVESMQKDHANVSEATTGMEVGMKVTSPVHENELVYKVTE